MSTPAILVSGLRSTGKSSLVCSLWGDASLLPTAERDCTQTNSFIRVPQDGESDRSVKLVHLPRERAIQFALRGAAYYRIESFLKETLSFEASKLEELAAEEKLKLAQQLLQQIFESNRRLAVLNESLTDDAEELKQLCATLDKPDFPGDKPITADWSERRDHMMGTRGPDSRILDTGRLQTLDRVELLRETSVWNGPPPLLIDTPCVPAVRGGRRQDLVLEQARKANALLIASRPDRAEPEEWLRAFLKERPRMAERTLLVFNQIDTVDMASLFSRDGFSGAYETSLEKFREVGVSKNNVCMTCARLPFLELSLKDSTDPLVNERLTKLKKTLARLVDHAGSRQPSPFRDTLIAAAKAPDGGLQLLRDKLRAILKAV
jgi:hypothetical protein